MRSVVARLRDPETGCPWDLAQTPASLLPYTVEEVYELIDAIERDASTDIREELGDLLYHVLFYSRIGAEQGRFDIDDVIDGIHDKLVRRHPHVFSDAPRGDAEQRRRDWARIKAEEHASSAHRSKQSGVTSSLTAVAAALPALLRANRLIERAALVGFRWTDDDQALAKVEEELEELRHELDETGDLDRIEAEIGDLLLAVTGLARHHEIDAETALRRACDRFVARFSRLEQTVRTSGRSLDGLTTEELLVYWRQAKHGPGPQEAI